MIVLADRKRGGSAPICAGHVHQTMDNPAADQGSNR